MIKAKKYLALLGFIAISCNNFKQASLYPEKGISEEPEHIGSFYSLRLYDDFINNEHWISPNNGCLKASVSTDIKYSGKASLHLQWDKGKEDCPWLGAGFGWDNWASKNISSIVNSSAIQFKVRTEKGLINGLPLAASIEDYNGVQAWIGMSPNTIKGGKVSEKWTTVTLPFSEFEYEGSDIDLSSVKQFIIQFEAEGDIYLDEMKIVPFKGSLKKRISLSKTASSINIDGALNSSEWGNSAKVEFDQHQIRLHLDEDYLYVAARIKDNNPLLNSKNGKDLWNGDALEIAFSTNSNSAKKRKSFLFSDQHIIIKASKEPLVWDFRKSRVIDAEVKTDLEEIGYTIEAKIPLSSFGSPEFKEGELFNIEFAVDVSDAQGNRSIQNRWNSGSRDGFYTNPSLWGELFIQSKQ